MLRAEMRDSENALILKLDGRFTGVDAEHLRTLVMSCDIERELIVNLTEVTFVDPVGEATLSLLSRLGAKFVAEDAYTLDICKRLHLRLARNSKISK